MHTLCYKIVALKIYFSRIHVYMSYGNILRDYRKNSALKKVSPLESENLTCATLRGHLSSS